MSHAAATLAAVYLAEQPAARRVCGIGCLQDGSEAAAKVATKLCKTLQENTEPQTLVLHKSLPSLWQSVATLQL